jgi:transposase
VQAYISAVSESAPNAQIIFDRFHVQRLVQDALDEVRRAEVRTLEEPGDRSALKNTRFALLRRTLEPHGHREDEADRVSPKMNKSLSTRYCS